MNWRYILLGVAIICASLSAIVGHHHPALTRAQWEILLWGWIGLWLLIGIAGLVVIGIVGLFASRL